jgi:hypothetical protein
VGLRHAEPLVFEPALAQGVTTRPKNSFPCRLTKRKSSNGPLPSENTRFTYFDPFFGNFYRHPAATPCGRGHPAATPSGRDNPAAALSGCGHPAATPRGHITTSARAAVSLHVRQGTASASMLFRVEHGRAIAASKFRAINICAQAAGVLGDTALDLTGNMYSTRQRKSRTDEIRTVK